MKKLAFCAAALTLIAGSAIAADLPSYKAPPPPPPPPPLWTGFYVGLNAGGAWSGSNSVTLASSPIYYNPNALVANSFASAAAFGATGLLGSGNNGGFIGGGQIGYNWQFYNSFVAGVEADIQGIAASRSNATAFTAVPGVVGVLGEPYTAVSALSASKSLDYIGTVRGRLGWLFTPTLLIYGTGGLAYGGVNLSVSGVQGFTPTPPGATTTGFLSGTYSDTRVGWTAGGGLEWLFWPNWSAKVEYLYYDLGSVQTNAGLTTAAATGLGPFAAGETLWTNASWTRTRFDGHIVRAGLNYHFNWGAAPVVAKF